MKHCLQACIAALLVLVLVPGLNAGPAFATAQPEKENPQAEPPPDEGQEEEEEVPPEAEEEPPQEPEQQPPEQQAPPQPQQQPPQQAPPPQPQQQPGAARPQVSQPPPPAAAPAQPPKATPTPPQPPQGGAPKTAAPTPTPSTVPPSTTRAAAPARTRKAPAELEKIQGRLRSGPVGQDPVARRYMDLIDRGEATVEDFNSFAVYLAKKNFLKDAEAYARVAVKMDKTNRDYWLNLGTIRLQASTLSSALVAYKKAKKLDPNYALAWYSLGVVYDYMRKYDKAVQAYTNALALDPSLGDSKTNPQVVNNDRLLVVNLLLYQGKEGGLAMALRGGPPADKPDANGKKTSTKSR